jgi:O-glycosyl hydrolase
MTIKLNRALIKNVFLVICLNVSVLSVNAQPGVVTLKIDGAVKYQTMDGFGVNINPAWWYNGSYTDAKVVQDRKSVV